MKTGSRGGAEIAVKKGTLSGRAAGDPLRTFNGRSVKAGKAIDATAN
jgi:hypothetical protein